MGALSGRLTAACVAALAALPAPGLAQPAAPAPLYRVADPDLTALEALLAPTLEANRKDFDSASGLVSGFGAGDSYPQLWLRDGATLLPLARWLYPRPVLASWIEAHFALQRSDGALYDWIAAGPPEAFAAWAPRAVLVSAPGAPPLSADRNSVEADQEASGVLAALAVYRITGDRAWLEAELGGRPLLQRLQDALQFVVRRRLDLPSGLVSSGFTADWGDVSPVYPDQRAIYLDAETPRVLGLYTNALFHAAAVALRDVLEELGWSGRAAYWDHVAGRIASGAERELWQPRRGYYRAQRLLHPAQAPGWDDPARFALGGNAVALLHGLAPPERAAAILAAAEAGRRRSGVSTIAGVLHPPFPRGFFRHPALAVPFEYQNGGQWDWFAGRLLLAAFEAGHSERALGHLVEIARKARRARGLYEWHTRSGEGRGSARYAGSAGALGAALLQGLFGVRMSAARLDLSVRLGSLPGSVSLREPATGVSLAYEYSASPERLQLVVRGDHPAPGRLELRLPAGRRARALKVDGERRALSSERRGEDAYAVVPGAWLGHRVELELEAG